MRIPLFLIPIVVAIVIQILKLIIDYQKDKKFHIEKLFVWWGFPSVHTGISASLIIVILNEFGIYSPEFAISLIFSILFWYDASNVRYEAGKHARIINRIRIDLESLLHVQDFDDMKTIFLKERLWHTFVEVLWWLVVGSSVTIILIYIVEHTTWFWL